MKGCLGKRDSLFLLSVAHGYSLDRYKQDN